MRDSGGRLPKHQADPTKKYQIITEFLDSNNKIPEVRKWYKYGKLHRDSGAPTRCEFNSHGEAVRVSWHDNGILHRLNGPALIYNYRSGKDISEIWYLCGVDLSTHEVEAWLLDNEMTAPYSIEDCMAIKLMWT